MSLLIATPMYGAQCHAEHFKSCMALKESLIEADVAHDWLVTTNESLITRARNTSATKFLQTDYHKLMFIDADISFEPEAVAHLWNMGAQVAVGAYRMKTPGAPLTVWKDGVLQDAKEFDEPTPVDYAGTGFMMIDREVFERLQMLHPEWKYEEGIGECWAFFQDPIRDIHLSEDYFFCQEWREAGGEILWNPKVELVHWGQRGY